ncbi:salicylate hydroxylase [Xylariales sp. PMI_506]|nr:salicylate hydroxylase [Xylariales sp. PMI_506]
MEIIIVGAGIGGLSTAISLSKALADVPECQPLKIVVLEAAPELRELGAGVQMAPQAIKHMFTWGMEADILAASAVPTSMKVRESATGEIIAKIGIGDLAREYGAPYLMIHRAVLHGILHAHALRCGVDVVVGSRVAEYTFEAGAVTLTDGTTRTADLIIAADGINSLARKQFLGADDPGSQPTGWAAFRMMTLSESIRADPEVADLLEGFGSNLWAAEGASCMTYLIKDSTVLNIVLSHRDTVDTSTWTLEEHQNYVNSLFKHFDPRVKKLLDMAAPSITNYAVYAVPTLKKWAHESGRFVILGDAAHAMAFYLSMGVSLAVEDAVALGESLRLACSDPASATREDRLKTALQRFQQVRIPRAASIQAGSLHAGNVLHGPPGPQREVRNEGLRRWDEYWPPEPLEQSDRAEYEDTRQKLYGIGDKRTRDWCYGYDSGAAIREAWQQ